MMVRGNKKYGGEELELPLEDPRREVIIEWLAERDGIHTLNPASRAYLGIEVDFLLERLDRVVA